jgi:hypothetical protein
MSHTLRIRELDGSVWLVLRCGLAAWIRMILWLAANGIGRT